MVDDPTCVSAAVHPGGAAPAIALLHSLAMDRTMWEDHVADLGRRYPVVTCDLPGHGRSCRVAETTVEEMADEVAVALTRTGLAPFIVVGLSLGGCVAQALATRHPDTVAGLCLVDTTAWYGPDAPARWEERAQRVLAEGFEALSQFQLDRWFTPGFRAAEPDTGERLLDVFRANDVPSYVATCRAMGAFDGRARLGDIHVPTVVLVGEHDGATPVSDAEVLAAGISGAELRVLPGLRHMTPVEDPAALIAAVDDVRERLRPVGSA